MTARQIVQYETRLQRLRKALNVLVSKNLLVNSAELATIISKFGTGQQLTKNEMKQANRLIRFAEGNLNV